MIVCRYHINLLIIFFSFKLTKLEHMPIYDCISIRDDFGMFECFISFTFQIYRITYQGLELY